jgi:hypothetical protein
LSHALILIYRYQIDISLLGKMAEDAKTNIPDSKARREAYLKEYFSRQDVIERHRAASIRVGKQKKLATTARRFEEHTMDELLSIASNKCKKHNVDFELKKEGFIELFKILHEQ